jgi:hypothetical protein
VKISKKVREQAAMICAIAASTETDYGTRPTYEWDVAPWLGVDRCHPSVTLALKAWRKAFRRDGGPWTAVIDAEAEAILRTGWAP